MERRTLARLLSGRRRSGAKCKGGEQELLEGEARAAKRKDFLDWRLANNAIKGAARRISWHMNSNSRFDCMHVRA